MDPICTSDGLGSENLSGDWQFSDFWPISITTVRESAPFRVHDVFWSEPKEMAHCRVTSLVRYGDTMDMSGELGQSPLSLWQFPDSSELMSDI